VKNTLFIIPVYNCAMHISELLYKINNIVNDAQILCINDGSVDNSLEIIKQHNVKYIDFQVNRGKGYALKTGFEYAKKNGYLFALTLDSDMQHDPAVLKLFFIAQKKENADIVIGFRKFNFHNMPKARVLSNYITSSIVSCIVKENILDSQSGYRLYKLDKFNATDDYNDRFQFETEILFNYKKKKAKIAYIEIPVIYNSENSNISHLRDITNFIKVCWKEIR
jgi:glycosyltransferase involved in cell wall biosynthesis